MAKNKPKKPPAKRAARVGEIDAGMLAAIEARRLPVVGECSGPGHVNPADAPLADE